MPAGSRRWIAPVWALLWPVVAASGAAADVSVFAASSLTGALERIGTQFEDATGHEVVVSLAGSSILARQIERGAPADIFISASPDWMDVLEDGGLLEPGTRRDLLSNRLVLIGTGAGEYTGTLGPDFPLADRVGEGRLAMALVDAVPVGIYGKAALESLGLWEDIAPRVAQTDNARAALALVATGAVTLGVVYATDAAAEARVHVVGTFPEESHPPIVYPAAAVSGRLSATAARFLDFLSGPEARAVFEAEGFAVLPP